MSQVMLSVHNVSVKTRTGEVIVQPISFELFAGEALTIVGETGSGKTLLAQAIANNLSDDLIAEGEIFLHGKPIHTLDKNARDALWGKTICVLPQEPMRSLDPTMRAAKQVREGYEIVGKLSQSNARKRTQEDFETVKLPHATGKFPFELSGGMAQRVAFLASRSGGATFTIADEPTKGLDANRRDDIAQQLRTLIEQNEGVFTITHDIEVAHQLGGRVMIMRQGEVIEDGNSEQVLHYPNHAYTQELIDADPRRWTAHDREAQDIAPIVEAKNVSKSRGGKTLFSELSFALKPGQIFGVSGDSGCGKSTLGDMLLGLLSTDSGSIDWAHDPNAKHKAQKLFQDPSDVFSAHVKLRKSFNDVMKKYHISEDKLNGLLDELRLDKRLIDRYPDQVSGGELQRLAIVRVMLLDPTFIFADEPTSRLDMLTQKSVIEALANAVKHHNVAMMIVSHDKALLEKVCDEVVVFG